MEAFICLFALCGLFVLVLAGVYLAISLYQVSQGHYQINKTLLLLIFFAVVVLVEVGFRLSQLEYIHTL